MVITFTPNPAVDQTGWLTRLEAGSVNRVHTTHLDPAGKGVNASRMVHRLGWPTIAFGFVAGDIGRIIESALDQEEVQYHFLQVPGQTRVNMTVVEERDRRSTSVYAPGPEVEDGAQRRMIDLLQFWLQAGRILVLAGSLPPGMPADFYARLIRVAREHGGRLILDADEAALQEGMTAGPDVVKPNVEEAERLLGRSLPDRDAVVEATREMASGGVELAVISMGSDGAICVHGDRAWRVAPPPVAARSSVGSGDSFVAGLATAMARGSDVVEGLRLAAAAGAATAMTPGTALGRLSDVAELLPAVMVESM